jgi:hypothetical protein
MPWRGRALSRPRSPCSRRARLADAPDARVFNNNNNNKNNNNNNHNNDNSTRNSVNNITLGARCRDCPVQEEWRGVVVCCSGWPDQENQPSPRAKNLEIMGGGLKHPWGGFPLGKREPQNWSTLDSYLCGSVGGNMLTDRLTTVMPRQASADDNDNDNDCNNNNNNTTTNNNNNNNNKLSDCEDFMMEQDL